MQNNKLDIIIAGAGLVGKRHVQALQAEPRLRLSAIVDPDPEISALTQELGVPAFETLEDAFQAGKPNGVILSTPTAMHKKNGEFCLSQGCPTLIEKPITVNAEEARALVDQSEALDVPILVGHHRRHNPLIQAAHAAVHRGDIGEINAVNATCWFYKPDAYFDKADWRKKKGAGPILVNLVHDVDLIRYLCGEVASVHAFAKPSHRGFENEEVAGAVMYFENGAIGTISVSDTIVSPWSWELTSGEYPIYPKTDQNCYLLGGTKGSLSVPDLRIWRHENEPDWWSPIGSEYQSHESSDPLVNQIRHFADVIEGKAAPLVSAREGLKTLEVVEAIHNSAQMQTRIDISSFL